MVAAGTLLSVAGTARAQTLNPSFGAGGTAVLNLVNTSDFWRDVATQPDGKIVAVGSRQVPNLPGNFFIARYLPSGQLDASFNGTGLDGEREVGGADLERQREQRDELDRGAVGPFELFDLCAAGEARRERDDVY